MLRQFEIARSIRLRPYSSYREMCLLLRGDVFYSEMVDSMNEPPGARMRVGLSALTVAEYFREDLQQDVLLFIGYQPTLATEMVQAEERPVIASRRICGGLPLQLELATKAAAVSQIHIRATEMQAGVQCPTRSPWVLYRILVAV